MIAKPPTGRWTRLRPCRGILIWTCLKPRASSPSDVALYIFTSGTTGLPKAATYKHQRLVTAANLLGKLTLRPKPGDRLYLCLPIYHITGLGPGLCGFIAAGGTICLRRTFSASKFWSEVQAWQTNSFVYVGELCRYLVTQAPSNAERNNPLQKMVGNGLRPDVWDEFKSRFEVKRICEIYGSSEGNVTFLNLLNKDRTIGTTSVEVALVKYDVNEDAIVRDDAGLCELAKPGEPGLLLGKITDITPFDGYTNAEATNSKIIENVKEAWRSLVQYRRSCARNRCWLCNGPQALPVCRSYRRHLSLAC